MPKKQTLADLSIENLLNKSDGELDPALRAMKRNLELMTKQEDLLPELQPHVMMDGSSPMIHHPLVVSMISSNAQVNEIYRQKTEVATKAKESRDWFKYIFTHERPYQLELFGEIADQLDDSEYWELLGQVFCESENLRQHPATLKNLLTSSRPRRERIMNGRDRAYFKKLPNRFTIYRGYAHQNAAGWSWTLDLDKAKWFARRFAHADVELAGKPRLATGTVKKRDVIAYFSGRKEKEIVVEPTKVKIVSREAV